MMHTHPPFCPPYLYTYKVFAPNIKHTTRGIGSWKEKTRAHFWNGLDLADLGAQRQNGLKSGVWLLAFALSCLLVVVMRCVSTYHARGFESIRVDSVPLSPFISCPYVISLAPGRPGAVRVQSVRSVAHVRIHVLILRTPAVHLISFPLLLARPSFS